MSCSCRSFQCQAYRVIRVVSALNPHLDQGCYLSLVQTGHDYSRFKAGCVPYRIISIPYKKCSSCLLPHNINNTALVVCMLCTWYRWCPGVLVYGERRGHHLLKEASWICAVGTHAWSAIGMEVIDCLHQLVGLA